jgi:transglutaminase-like putative cysteine protease
MKHITKTIIAATVALISVGIATASDNRDLAWQYVRELSSRFATPDRTDYSEEFYYRNYLTTLQARDEMPWGKTVPERELMHFVLPVRVNNENLDTARIVFYRELKDRVKNLSMEDAILEVNHWCHEKVSYRPSDARTSSPLATMRTAYGRCGEESTFLVAALRSVCIPARQVYTPRWAHTDDNHAWVEAWANGKWYFLGACEPEPVLNLGWFNESASRGMLMHTKVAGDYHGPEEVVSRTPCYTEINVTSNYTPTSNRIIKVHDKNGNPVPNATVEFKLYNYAEFYTVAKGTTNERGNAALTAGKGDLLVWVTKDDLVAVKKVSWAGDKGDFEVIELCDKALPRHLELDIVPPPLSAKLPEVTDEQRALNDRRKAQEDSIRQAYEATMPVEAWRGNHRTIQQFLDEAKNKVMARKLLDVLSEKDLRDINLDVLRDNEVAETDTTEIYCRYVLCPRVENEWLTPYKAFLKKELSGKVGNILQLIAWTKENIGIENTHNPQHLRQQPMSVYRTSPTDELGRAIFFVSAARSIGWPARINEVNGKLEYYANNVWHEVKFEESVSLRTEPTGTLKLNFTPSDTHNDLAYYTHFTLSKLVKNSPQLLTYPEDATWSNTFKEGVELEPGTYILTTGNRQSDGSVLASITTFEIESDKESNVDLSLRGNDIKVEIIGKIDTKGKYRDISDNTIKDVFNKNGFTIVGYIRPNHEPTNHALRDIATYAKDFENINCSIVLINHWKQPFNSTEFNNLPATTKWGTIDDNLDILWKVADKMGIDGWTDPIFLLCDKDGNVYFIKEGYTIHLGEQLLKTIKKIEASRKN